MSTACPSLLRRAAPLLVLLAVLACGVEEPEPQGDALRRWVALEGAHNFRDLGGYATQDGRRVRWGQLYRSDDLSELTEADLELISELGIQLVCDFRGPDEREAEPDRLPEVDPPDVALLAIADDRLSPSDLRDRLLSGDFDDRDLSELLVEGNRAFATTFADRYAAMLERISSPENRPALVHCTAGKDRAGFAAAVLLRALGVPRETVFEDYLLTNLYTAPTIERQLQLIRIFSFFRTHPDEARPLFEARPEYLSAAFEAIDERWGSFDAYLRGPLGMDDEELHALREQLLE